MALANHDRTLLQCRGLFLEYDQQVMIDRFGLKADDTFLYLPFLGKEHRIDRASGLVERPEGPGGGFAPAPFCSAMSIYDYLCRSKPCAYPAGRYARIGSLGGAARASNPDDTLYQNWAALFETDLPAFRRACRALGGTELNFGDAAYQINMFPSLAYQLRLWLSDDEFPADLQILCDENTLDFVCFETSFFMAGQLLTEVKELFQSLRS